MHTPALGTTLEPITNRSLAYLAADMAAARALAQATVNVELFTIPLYMGTMYSLHGMHQINAKGQSFYMGREWPGMAPSAKPVTDNDKAFNLMFSVFIQEMLHLQMAANIATSIGVSPSFTSAALQTPQRAWHCYGPDCSMIPHIVDLKDTSSDSQVKVMLGAVNSNQIQLFMAIEQPEAMARAQLQHAPPNKYFPSVPFVNWDASKSEMDLPMFGTIGWMYECYARYLSISYADGQTLFSKMYDCNAVQRDLFNTEGQGHPKREFPAFATRIQADCKDSMEAFDQVIDMMSAISDQGEGNAIQIQRYRQRAMLRSVEKKYQEDKAALEVDYPSYDQTGEASMSCDAVARGDNAGMDHYERFEQVMAMLPRLTTWEQWHQQGGHWSASDLYNAQYNPTTAPTNIPAPEQVAGALNRLKARGEQTHMMLSQVSVGAIAGITTVLDKYWQDLGTEFPYPSMSGSGDRMSICWAIMGQAPDLSRGLDQPDPGKLYHACQGLSLADPDTTASCAAIEIYHTCKGSNGCHAQGGCGFVQSDAGGGSCGASSCGATGKVEASVGAGCGAPPIKPLYSAPSDNKCATFGGCAVPISASQLYPAMSASAMMKLYDFIGPEHNAQPLNQTMPFAQGDAVYAKAWEAYKAVMAERQTPVEGDMPEPTDLRLALPPST